MTTALTSRLTPHVTLEELIRSTTAKRLGIDNTPSSSVLIQLQRLADMIELVRSELNDAPILVSSDYRCHALNQAVGGATNSAHVTGCAVDFTAPRFGPPETIFQRLAKSTLPFDQLIYEDKNGTTWVHLGIAAEQATPRRQLLAIHRHGARGDDE